MTRKRLRLTAVVGAALLLAGCGSSLPSPPGGPQTAATTQCAAISSGSTAAIAACAQGYAGAVAGRSLHAACLFGTGAVTAQENIRDCRYGFVTAPTGPKLSATAAPSAVAAVDCAGISHGSSASIPACEQGYDGATGGQTIDESCGHVGSGAVLSVENTQDCDDGWDVAKGQDGVIPGEQVQS